MKQSNTTEQKMNSIRAGILGANDGILTTCGVLFSTSVASGNTTLILLTGVSNLVACALSMGSGEFMSVSSQRDLEQQLIKKESNELRNNKKKQLAQISQYYQNLGVSKELAEEASKHFSNPIQELLENNYNIELGHAVSPISAALFSLIFALIFGSLPLLFMYISPEHLRLVLTLIGCLISSNLVIYLSGKLSNSFTFKSLIKNTIFVLICILANYIFGYLI